MIKVGIIFINTKHKSALMTMFSQMVTVLTDGWSHVAMYLFDGIYESVRQGVDVYPKDKYDSPDSYIKKEIIWISLTEKGYKKMEIEAQRLIGRNIKYGIWDCILAFIADSISLKTAIWLNKKFPSPWNMMCSGTISHLLKIGEFKGLDKSTCPPEILTPRHFYSILKVYQNENE